MDLAQHHEVNHEATGGRLLAPTHQHASDDVNGTRPLEDETPSEASSSQPTLLHRFRSSRSILALAISKNGDCIYAGTQAGEIVVYALKTYERIQTVQAHRGAVLALCLVESSELDKQTGDAQSEVSGLLNHGGTATGAGQEEQKGRLFSCAGDRMVNVWDIVNLRHLVSIYSVYDVGDVFCITYSARLETIYLGAQNTSIQVCKGGQA